MVILLNLLPALIVLLMLGLGLRAVYKHQYLKVAIYFAAMIALLAVHSALLPSYLPKGDVRVEPPPEFSTTEAPVKDISLKAKPEAERQAEFDKKFDWKEKANESKK